MRGCLLSLSCPSTILACSYYPTRVSVARFSGFFFLFSFSKDNFVFLAFQIFRYRDIHHFFALWWARNNIGVIFSFVYMGFAFFTFHVLVAYDGPRGYS